MGWNCWDHHCEYDFSSDGLCDGAVGAAFFYEYRERQSHGQGLLRAVYCDRDTGDVCWARNDFVIPESLGNVVCFREVVAT